MLNQVLPVIETFLTKTYLIYQPASNNSILRLLNTVLLQKILSDPKDSRVQGFKNSSEILYDIYALKVLQQSKG